MTTRDQRIEAALAFGRSDGWIKQHMGASDTEIAKVRADWAELLSLDPWYQRHAAGINVWTPTDAHLEARAYYGRPLGKSGGQACGRRVDDRRTA